MYKKIETDSSKMQNLSFGEDDEAMGDVVELEDDPDTEEDDQEDDEVVEDDDIEDVSLENAIPKKEVKQEKQVVKKPSRSEQRIRQLANEKNDLARQLDEERKARQELEKSHIGEIKTTKVDRKAALEEKLKIVARGLANAIQEGEAETAVALNEEMFNVKLELRELGKDIEQYEAKEKAPEKQTQTKEQPDLPKKAVEWIENNPAFLKDPIFYNMSIAISQQLVNEGFSDRSDEFYQELDERLSPRFPEYFTVEHGDEDEEGEAQPKQVVIKKKPTQTLGSSRALPNQKPTTKKKATQIEISPQDMRRAKRWGISVEQLSRRMDHINKNRGGDGYVPIIIDKK